MQQSNIPVRAAAAAAAAAQMTSAHLSMTSQWISSTKDLELY